MEAPLRKSSQFYSDLQAIVDYKEVIAIVNTRTWIVVAAVLGGLGVLAGTYHAHGLEEFLRVAETASQDPEEFVDKRMDQFSVAVLYQMVHALALLAVGLMAMQKPSAWLTASAACFLAGVVLFSGLLYALVLTNTPRLGMIVPIGGLSLIVGWVLLAVAGWRLRAIETR